MKANRKSDTMSVVMKVSVITIIVNLILSVFKLAAGIVGNSGAMISDGVHSASDVLSTFVVMIGVKISNKDSDKEHPYGHERMESIAAVILAVILFITGMQIGLKGLEILMKGQNTELVIPNKIALIAAVASIMTKEAMYWYTRHHAKKINSSALMADAWHHRSDALSSVGAFVGIGGALMGYPIMDPLASVIICFFILKAAVEIFKDALDKMVDKSCDESIEKQIRNTALQQKGVESIDLLHTRMFGNRIYVELEISADGKMTLEEAHRIAENVHDAIENGFSQVKHVMVHVNPKM